MEAASLKRAPVFCVRLARSEPAKSTMESLLKVIDERLSSRLPPRCHRISLSVKTLCEREESWFKEVSATFLYAAEKKGGRGEG